MTFDDILGIRPLVPKKFLVEMTGMSTGEYVGLIEEIRLMEINQPNRREEMMKILAIEL